MTDFEEEDSPYLANSDIYPNTQTGYKSNYPLSNFNQSGYQVNSNYPPMGQASGYDSRYDRKSNMRSSKNSRSKQQMIQADSYYMNESQLMINQPTHNSQYQPEYQPKSKKNRHRHKSREVEQDQTYIM